MTTAEAKQFFDEALRAMKEGNVTAALAGLWDCWHAAEIERDLRLDVGLSIGEIAARGSESLGQEAQPVLEEVIQIAGDNRLTRRLAAALHALALILWRRGEHDAAKEHLGRSPVLALGDRPSRELAQFFHYRSLLKNEYELISAERDLYRAYQFYQETNCTIGISQVCDSLANILLRSGKTDAALDFCEQSLRIKHELGDLAGEAISYGTLGRIYLNRAEYESARAAFQRDLEVSRRIDDRTGVGVSLNSLGEIDWIEGRLKLPADSAQECFASALGHYRQSIEEHNSRLNRTHAHLGLARVLISMKKLEDAEHEFTNVEGILREGHELRGQEAFEYSLTGLRGSIAWRRGESDAGIALLQQAIGGLRQLRHAIDTVPFLYELRDLYTEKGQVSLAFAALSEAVDVLSEHGAAQEIRLAEDWFRQHDETGLLRLALEQHFPDFIAEKVIQGSLAERSAEKRQVIVLFSDIRGFTTMSEKLDPVQVVELLNEWLSEATRAVQRNGGYVDKFIGDAIMAVFGVPAKASQNDASRAVQAALEMSESLWTMNLRHQTLRNNELLRVGIGIASGDAVIGFVGSHRRYSYTVLGDVVNVASRLESATKEFPGCEILISEAVEIAHRADQLAETRFVGNLQLKGKDRRIAAYEVLGRIKQ